ncbi:MAG: hypothetical protein EOO13_11520, partial [Chitinophagaceae bacterium]
MRPSKVFTHFFFSIILLLPCYCLAQNDSSKPNKKRIIGTIPVGRNTTINGLAIGFYLGTRKKARELRVNGVSISATPLDPLAAVYTLFDATHAFSKDTIRNARSRPLNTRNMYPEQDTSRSSIKANGLLIGSFLPEHTQANGMALSFIINGANQLNGLAITGFININYTFKGVQVAGLH